MKLFVICLVEILLCNLIFIFENLYFLKSKVTVVLFYWFFIVDVHVVILYADLKLYSIIYRVIQIQNHSGSRRERRNLNKIVFIFQLTLFNTGIQHELHINVGNFDKLYLSSISETNLNFKTLRVSFS